MGRKLDLDDMLDSADVARILGLAHGNAVSVYRSRYPDFPEPVIERGRCALWLRRDIEKWGKVAGDSRRPRIDATVRRSRLTAFVRRSIYGLRAQRLRLAVDHPTGFDLDFYAHAAWLLRESIRQGIRRTGLRELQPVLDELDAELPHLKDYRDVITHAVDDRMSEWAWFGQFATRLLPRGKVEYLIDSRYDHDKLERFGRRALELLDPVQGVDDPVWGSIDDGRPAAS